MDLGGKNPLFLEQHPDDPTRRMGSQDGRIRGDRISPKFVSHGVLAI